jgi:PEGA domain
MVKTNAAEPFEWPPAPEVLTGQVVEFTSEGIEPTQHLSGSVASAAPSPRVAGPTPNLPEPPQQEEVHVSAPRVLEQRASAAKLSEPPMRLSQSWSRISSSVVPIALVVVALTALLEGVYIVRTLSLRPTSFTANSAQTALPNTETTAERVRQQPAPVPPAITPGRSSMALPHGETTAERAPQQAAPVAPAITAGPSATNAVDVGARPRPRTGRLVVRSDPSGAQVFVDGRLYGVTPLTLESVRTGEHRIVLKRNATELEQILRVEPGSTMSVVAPMQSSATPFGWVAIASPVEVEVFEDGARLGTSRRRQIILEAGPHTLELVNEDLGFRQTQQVRVEAGRAASITVALPMGTMSLNAVPWAEVWIHGKLVGETPIANLPIVIGTHEIVFRHPELGEKTVSTTVKAGIPTRLSADLRQQPSGSR